MTEPVKETILGNQIIVGNPSVFAIGYAFVGEDRITEVSMFVDGANVLGFIKGGAHRTLRWAYLEGLVAWLKDFACNMKEDPFPADVDGEYANERIARALELGPEDEDEFADFIGPVWDWVGNHSWLSERGGAILSNVYLELKDGFVEMSWDNRKQSADVVFDCEVGGARVDAETFKAVTLGFVDAYEERWGIKVDDDSTWDRKN